MTSMMQANCSASSSPAHQAKVQAAWHSNTVYCKVRDVKESHWEQVSSTKQAGQQGRAQAALRHCEGPTRHEEQEGRCAQTSTKQATAHSRKGVRVRQHRGPRQCVETPGKT